MRALLALVLAAAPAWAAGPCRDKESGRFIPCPEPPALEAAEAGTKTAAAPAEERIRVRAMAGALTSFATDTPAAIKPLVSLGIEAPLSTSSRGPSLEVLAELNALPGESIDFTDPQTFNALEVSIGLSQPIHPAVLFRVYLDAGAASRLATSEEPVSRLPGWWSAGLLFRTKSRDHWLKCGLGSDQRLSGQWAAAVTVSGQAKVGERAGVSLYLVGSMIRALDLSAYGYEPPPRDSLRIGVALGM